MTARVAAGIIERGQARGKRTMKSAFALELTEAGCDNELLLTHCRLPACAHACGSWAPWLVLRMER